ncbi:hypothetical protein NIES2107_14120 [Nostoc carneum NIES-2107]|nr:hypothetical protein NIES2107_14120 [Nostoc carneum NIES-2107]
MQQIYHNIIGKPAMKEAILVHKVKRSRFPSSSARLICFSDDNNATNSTRKNAKYLKITILCATYFKSKPSKFLTVYFTLFCCLFSVLRAKILNSAIRTGVDFSLGIEAAV